MTKFHNPYHFVPVWQRAPGDHDLSTEAFLKATVGDPATGDADPAALRHAGHHHFASTAGDGPVYHGRILCRLENEDPFFIGGRRVAEGTEQRPADWVPYELADGRPAIPASSLRGLCSAIAEAASGSALRVLQEGPYSRRAFADAADPLRALGEVVRMDPKDGMPRLGVRPLPEPISLCAYRQTGIMVGGERQVVLEPHPQSAIPAGTPSYSADHQAFWYLSRDQQTLLTEADYLKKPAPGYQRGILHILGIEDSQGGRRHLPTSRVNELFIPYPANQPQEKPLAAEEAVERFHALADECTRQDADLPFAVAGSQRNGGTDPEDHRIRLRPGDLVYFRRDPSHPDKAAEVALSAIWRKGIGGTRHAFFRAVSPELLPFSLERTRISPAELVFGLVEARAKASSDAQALGLAGRVRFAHGLLTAPAGDGHYLDPVILKVLDSPKPPYPAFYFRHARAGAGGFIAKSTLSLKAHVPQGRKFYLHRYVDDKDPGKDARPWETHAENKTKTLKQKSRVTPVRPGRVFWFHVDFDNLTEYELGMLCYALRPTEAFRHKLGMGKPIGLGRVRIDPVGLFLIDRTRRYGADGLLDSRRYHRIALTAGAEPNDWPAPRYGSEAREAQAPGDAVRADGLFDQLRGRFRDGMDRAAGRALVLLGDPDQVQAPVHTPQVANKDGAMLEHETYEWFVINEKGRRQHLCPLDEDSDALPTLEP